VPVGAVMLLGGVAVATEEDLSAQDKLFAEFTLSAVEGLGLTVKTQG